MDIIEIFYRLGCRNKNNAYSYNFENWYYFGQLLVKMLQHEYFDKNIHYLRPTNEKLHKPIQFVHG